MNIRYGDQEEVASLEWALLYSEENDGDDFIIAEEDGIIRAWAQTTGSNIYFIESRGGGAGTAIVEWLKSKYGYLQAVNCQGTEAYWEKVGFTKIGSPRHNPDYDWYEGD